MTTMCIVMTSVDNTDTKKAIIKALLSQNLAACIQVQKIESHYVWQNELYESNEELLLIKTRTSCYDDVTQCILTHHNYDVPEIIQIPVSNAYEAYSMWVHDSTVRNIR